MVQAMQWVEFTLSIAQWSVSMTLSATRIGGCVSLEPHESGLVGFACILTVMSVVVGQERLRLARKAGNHSKEHLILMGSIPLVAVVATTLEILPLIPEVHLPLLVEMIAPLLGYGVLLCNLGELLLLTATKETTKSKGG